MKTNCGAFFRVLHCAEPFRHRVSPPQLDALFCFLYMILKNGPAPPHSILVPPPKSEIRADLSHALCSTRRLLSCCPPRRLPPPPLHHVCICCRPSTVKSCNIFAKIFIHQPGLRHCRVNEQQLLAHSKWILPARYSTWVFILSFQFYSLFLSPICHFYTCSGGAAECESITASTQQLICKWDSFVWRQKWCNIWKEKKKKRKENCWLYYGGGEKKIKSESHVIECIILSAGGNNDCTVCRRHAHNVPLRSPSAVNLLFPARGHRLQQRNVNTTQKWKIKKISSFSGTALRRCEKKSKRLMLDGKVDVFPGL